MSARPETAAISEQSGPELKPVVLRDNFGGSVPAIFSFDPDNDSDLCNLTLILPNRQISASESDYFEAMCTIRRALEREGWQLICFGSSRNVFPSNMSRDMGCKGEMAYKLRLGSPARVADLVSIFDSDAEVAPVSVEQQEAFFRKWLDSLKR